MAAYLEWVDLSECRKESEWFDVGCHLGAVGYSTSDDKSGAPGARPFLLRKGRSGPDTAVQPLGTDSFIAALAFFTPNGRNTCAWPRPV